MLMKNNQPINFLDGIKAKIIREVDMRIKKKNPITNFDTLIFQRFLGHKEEIPGSGMWFESSAMVPYRPHNKHDCWSCEGHVYSVIFWSKGMAYKLDPIFNKQHSEIVRYEIDLEFGQDEDAEFVHCNGGLAYEDLDDRIPYLCGSFTGWRYIKMHSLGDFCREHDTKLETPFEHAKS